ncbi:MAG: hypothetical protein ACYC64_13250 [Armatimonadota bacterium]
MKITWNHRFYPALMVVALTAASGSAGLAQQSLLKTQDARYDMQVGVYHPNAEGNQDWVREYDGRDMNFLGFELFDTYGYKNGLQYWFNARDLIVGDESVDFGFAHRNIYRLSGGTNELTHRLAPIPANNPWVAAQLGSISPAPPAAVQGLTWDTFKNLSPNQSFVNDRRVNTLDLYVNPDARQRIGLAANWWQEDEEGQQQLLFRARQAKTGVINNRDRAAVALPIDRETNEGTIGADLAVGKNAVVNYRFESIKFQDNRSAIATGSNLDFSPLNTLTRIGNETKSNIIKARATITDKLQFTGVQINRERTNSGSDIPTGFTGAGGALNKKQKIDSTNLAMVYRATDSLSFTGRWRHLGTSITGNSVFTGTSTTPANDSLSNDLRSMEFEGVFTGIPKAYLRFGYERRDVDREIAVDPDPAAELVLPATSLTTTWGIWRASLRYHPLVRLNLSANYENWGAGNSGFTGVANNRERTNVNATYMVRDNIAIYGDFSRWNDSNDQIRAAGAIPTPSTNAAEEEIREEAAGQGFHNDFTTTSIGAWFAMSDRFTLDANFGSVEMDSGAMWILGTSPTYLPHLTAAMVPFKSNNDQWSAGLNYLTSCRVKVYGRYFHANSTGASYVEPANFAGLGPQWSPFDIRQNKWTLGVGYGLSSKDSMSLDYSLVQWTDKVDANNDGQYGLWRMAWQRQY